MIEYIYVCRHGFRSNWVDSSITTSPTGMQRDPPLASYGIEQSNHLARFLADPEHHVPSKLDGPTAEAEKEEGTKYPPPKIIFSSPFYRCIQTSLALAQLLSSTKSPTTSSSSSSSSSSNPSTSHPPPTAIHLEHGIQEWYSAVKPHTGLHPRPSRAGVMRKFFQEGMVLGEGEGDSEDTKTGKIGIENQSPMGVARDAQRELENRGKEIGWRSTFWPSREGEGLRDLHDRVDGCLDALIPRIEATYPSVKSIVLYGHAASVIAIGRSLTGDPKLEVRAGCASTSLYRRRRQTLIDDNDSAMTSTTTTQAESTFATGWESGSTTATGMTDTGLNHTSPTDIPTAIASSVQTENGIGKTHLGQWEGVWNGRADYLPNGEERNWSFADILLNDAGDVIHDDGDHVDHSPADALPVGLDSACLQHSSGLHLRYRPAYARGEGKATDADGGSTAKTLVDKVGQALGLSGSKL